MSILRPNLDLLQKLVQEGESESADGNNGEVDSEKNSYEGEQIKNDDKYCYNKDDFLDDPTGMHVRADIEDTDTSGSPVETEDNDAFKKDQTEGKELHSNSESGVSIQNDSSKQVLKNRGGNEISNKKNVKKKKKIKKKKTEQMSKNKTECEALQDGDDGDNGKVSSNKDVPKNNGASSINRYESRSPSFESCDEEKKDSCFEQTMHTKKRPKSGKRKKVVMRSKPYIDPDVCLEDNLYLKYKELDGILSGHFVERTSSLTRSHLQQMHQFRSQYSQVSHGLPPTTHIVPRSLQSRFHGYGKMLPDCQDEHESVGDLSDVADDMAFQTLCSVMTANAAKKQKKLRSDYSKKIERKGNDVEKTSIAHNMTDKSTIKQQIDHMLTPSDNRLKNTSNPKIKQWLHKKNALYRQQKATERAKTREKNQVNLMKMSEKVVKTEQSNKAVEKWIAEKQKEDLQKRKLGRENIKGKKQLTHQIETNQNEENTTGIRGTGDNAEGQETESPAEIRERWKQQAIDRQKRKADGLDKEIKPQAPQPPKNKLVYKRPVAGRIKLRLPSKDKITKDKEKEETFENVRMSYDEWLVQKRNDEFSRKPDDLQQKQIRKSDSELIKVFPGLARKRIEKKSADKKHVDTGIRTIDGGIYKDGGKVEGTAGIKSPHKEQEENNHPYRLAKKSVKETNTQEKSYPPSPKPSAQSPRKATPTKALVQNLETVMNNKFETNPFKMPFPPDQGVPKHVADKQRLIFSEHIFDKLEVEERPEPQGCDSSHAPHCTSMLPPSDGTRHNSKLEEDKAAFKYDYSNTEREAATHEVVRDGNNVPGYDNMKPNKTFPGIGKRVSFSEETTFFQASEYSSSDTNSPKEDVHFVEDLKSADFDTTNPVELPSGTFLTSLD